MIQNSEIFLVDSNSFMTPYRFYYALDLVPAYWNAIKQHMKTGRIVVLDMVKEEIEKGKDELATWLSKVEDITVIPHVNAETILRYQEVIQYISTCGLYKATALHNWAQSGIADPWLIASAIANGYTLVTEEVGSGGLSKKNPNKAAKIPDVANHFGTKTINIYDMMRKLHIKIQ